MYWTHVITILSNKHIHYSIRHEHYDIMLILYYGYCHRLEVLKYIVYCLHMVYSGTSSPRWYQMFQNTFQMLNT